MTTPTQIVNRHMARLLTNLEDAGCPVLFLDAVKAELQWLRHDLETAALTDEVPHKTGYENLHGKN